MGLVYVVVGEWDWFEGSVVMVGHSDWPNPLWAKLGGIGVPQDGLKLKSGAGTLEEKRAGARDLFIFSAKNKFACKESKSTYTENCLITRNQKEGFCLYI